MSVAITVKFTAAPGTNANLAIAFLTGPWGTCIELTEGLTQIR
jgi:hypothetical protein